MFTPDPSPPPISQDHSDNKVYVVTLEDRNDLEGFYSDMASDGYQLQMKRPISRSTHYYMLSLIHI